MQKIARLVISIVIFGFTNADKLLNKDPKCLKFPTLVDLHRCCYQLEMSSYDIAFDKCNKKYANMPDAEHCATNCALNETKIGNPDGSINYSVYHDYLEGLVKDSVLVPYMMNIVHNCDTDVIQMLQGTQYEADKKKPCSQRGNLMRRCAASRGLLNCPLLKRLIGNTYCDKLIADTKSCLESVPNDVSVFFDMKIDI